MTRMRLSYLFLAIVLVTGTSWSLTNGPVQPEYMSFESVDASDLVNLPTGDFTYILPLGDVKGPAGVGYPVALSYHAGIMNDQEASWVGLGWTLNVGAINRAVRGFPDDYYGDKSSQFVNNPGDYGWNVDVGGGYECVSATVGFSYKASSGYSFDGLTSVGIGFSAGSVNVGAEYNLRQKTLHVGVGYGLDNVGVGVGITLGETESIWDAHVGYSLTNASSNQSQSVACFSINSKGHAGVSVGGASSFSMNSSSKGLFQTGWGFGMTIPIYAFRIDFGFNYWSWKYASFDYGNSYGYLYQAIVNGGNVAQNTPLVTKLYSTNDVLNHALHAAAEVSGGRSVALAKSSLLTGRDVIKSQPPDVNVQHVYDKAEQIAIGNFVLPSQDLYSVTGQGTGGVFQPFSNIAGRYSYRGQKQEFQALNGIIGKLSSNTGDGSPGSPFTYDFYFDSVPPTFSDTFQEGYTFRMLGEACMNLIDSCSIAYDGNPTVADNFDAVTAGSTKRAHNTFGTRIEPIFGLDPDFPTKLSGFAITDQEGKTYYYTQPLLSLQQVNYSNSLPQPPVNPSSGFFAINSTNNYNALMGPYATTWLLTAITGPDYVKMYNEKQGASKGSDDRLLPNEGDLGYWVAFNYGYGDSAAVVNGKVQDLAWGNKPGGVTKVSSHWRVPYYDSRTNPSAPYPHIVDSCLSESAPKYYSSFGAKEITYLKAIETPSEVAYFRTSVRQDGYGPDHPSIPTFPPNYIDNTALYYQGNVYTTSSLLSSSKTIYWDDKEQGGVSIDPLLLIGYSSGIYQNPHVFIFPDHATSLAPVDNDFAQCLSIRIPHSQQISVANIQALPDGTPIINIQYGGQAVYNAEFFWNTQHPQRIVTGNISILKDFTNCYNGNDYSFPTKISQDMPSTPYADYWYNEPGVKRGSSTSNAKCFYAKDSANYTILYATMYKCQPMSGLDPNVLPQTAMHCNCETYFTYNWNCYSLDHIEGLQVSTVLQSGVLATYVNRNPILQYAKKLDQVAWYSKSRFPFLNRFQDPRDVVAADTNPYSETPESYRRVNFTYNYECAPNTPNSMDPNGGRLTLKSVQVSAGPEANQSYFPPYFFSYQNASVPYPGFDKSDPWGFRSPDAMGDQSDPQLGVNWNLSNISLPSGGGIAIAYQRDFIRSSFAMMYKIKKDNLCARPTSEFLPSGSNYYDSFNVSNTSATLNNLTLSSITGIEKGSYFIAYSDSSSTTTQFQRVLCVIPDSSIGYYNKTTWVQNYDYFHKIVSIDTGNTTIYYAGPHFDRGQSKIYVIRKLPLACDGLRVTSITASSGNAQFITTYSYPDEGVVQLVPTQLLPKNFVNSFEIDSMYALRRSDQWKQIGAHGHCDCPLDNPNNPLVPWDETDRIIRRGINYMPISTDMTANYNNGSTSVIYPTVEVAQVKGDGVTKVNGSKKYHFWTADDWYLPKPILQEDTFTNNTGINIKKIIDRESIIGLTKDVEFFNNNGKSVYKKSNHYSFSDEIASSSGVVFGSATTKMADDSKGLGEIRQRGVRVDNVGITKSVADLENVIPILTGVTETKDNVTISTDYGLFDARTGTALATITSTSASGGDSRKKLDFQIPYHLLPNVSAVVAKLRKKNIWSLQGGSLTQDISNLGNNSSPANLTYSAIIGNLDSIRTPSGLDYEEELFDSSNVYPFSQDRFHLAKTYQWKTKGATFKWPVEDATNWLCKSRLSLVDRFSRGLSEVDPLGVSNSVVFHPNMNAVAATVLNSDWTEMGVFTGDYDMEDTINDSLHRGYFDYYNGWEKVSDTSMLTPKRQDGTYMHHFGKRCLIIDNASHSFGPCRNFKLEKGKNYIFSAWVCLSSGSSVSLGGDYRIAPKSAGLGFPYSGLINYGNTHPDSIHSISWSGTQTSTSHIWTHLEVLIPASTDLNNSNGYWASNDCFARVYVGVPANSGSVYVDDIRFYPTTAHVSSYYYDQDLGVPIAFVDENNKVKRFAYDVFGRLDSIFNNAGQLVSDASYNNSAPYGHLLIVNPHGGETFTAGQTLKVQWTSFGIVGNIALKYSIAGPNSNSWTTINASVANTGSYDWVLPTDVSQQYWLKIEEVTNPNDNYVVQTPIQLVNSFGHIIRKFIMNLLNW